MLWRHSGKSRQGVIYELMRSSRTEFKCALRRCRNRRNTIVADKLADRLSENDDRAFWKEIKNLNNIVGNANGNINITGYVV